MITSETRRQSYEEILTTLGKRQNQVLTELSKFPKGQTAGELAVHMWDLNYFDLPERNNVHPRLNEMIKLDIVEVVGKRKCSVTGKTCAVYKVKEGVKHEVK